MDDGVTEPGQAADGIERPARPRRRRSTRWLRVLVPIIGVLLAATVIAWPMLNPREPGFTLSFDDVRQSEQRLLMSDLRFEGTDSRGRPFVVTAASATQDGANAPIVDLKDVTASVTLKDGTWLNADAKTGTLHRPDDVLVLNGAVNLYSSIGYEVHGSDVKLDFGQSRIHSSEHVQGQGPLGVFQAAGFESDLATERLILQDRVRMTLYPQGRKGDG